MLDLQADEGGPLVSGVLVEPVGVDEPGGVVVRVGEDRGQKSVGFRSTHCINLLRITTARTAAGPRSPRRPGVRAHPIRVSRDGTAATRRLRPSTPTTRPGRTRPGRPRSYTRGW